MQAYVFRGRAGTYALSARDADPRLPSSLGPWRRWKAIVIDGVDTGRIGVAARDIATFRRDGYAVLREGLTIDDA